MEAFSYKVDQFKMITDLNEIIKYLESVKDEDLIPNKFVELDANNIYKYLIELQKLRTKVEKLTKRNKDLKEKLKDKNTVRAFKNPYDSIGLL